MAVGWLLGHYLVDGVFSSHPWGCVSLTLMGAAAGLYEIFRILLSDQRSRNGPRG